MPFALSAPLRCAAVVAIMASSACVPPTVHSGSHGVATLVTGRTGVQPSWSVSDSGVRPRDPIPEGPLDIEAAIRLAIARNPRVQSTLAEVGIAQAELWQASTWPNPVLDYVHGYPESGVAVSNRGVGFAFVRALQVPLRRRIAAAELASVERRVANDVFDVMVEVQRAYRTVQYAQQLLELHQAVAAASAASAAAARALRAAGNIPAPSLDSEEALAAQDVAEVSGADGELADARAELARLLGAGIADTAWSIPGRLPEPEATDWPLARADSLALARRLDVAAARESIRAASAAVGLSERFRFLADGTLGAAFEREPDGRFVGPTASAPFPLFDRGAAAIARGRAVLRQQVALHDALVVDVHADVRAQLARVRNARQQAQQLRTVVLPLRRRIVEGTQLHVNAMDLSVFALLQARQGEIEAGRRYLEAVRDYWIARAGLERATGGPLPTPVAP